MKFNPNVSSSRRKSRKAHFSGKLHPRVSTHMDLHAHMCVCVCMCERMGVRVCVCTHRFERVGVGVRGNGCEQLGGMRYESVLCVMPSMNRVWRG